VRNLFEVMEFGHYIGTARLSVCNTLRRSARRLDYDYLQHFSYPSFGVTPVEFCDELDIFKN